MKKTTTYSSTLSGTPMAAKMAPAAAAAAVQQQQIAAATAAVLATYVLPAGYGDKSPRPTAASSSGVLTAVDI